MPPKRSKASTSKAVSYASDSDSDSPQERPKKVAKKKSTSTSSNPFSKVKGVRGALSVFSKMPEDILIEIVSHVDHETLAVLCITLKAFRTILLQPFANKIWVNARKEIELSDLGTNDMSEWQYGSLLWGRNCQTCGKKGKFTKNFALRLRLCPACMKTRVCSDATFPKDLHALTRKCAIVSNYSMRGNQPPEYDLEALAALDKVIFAKFYSKLEPKDQAALKNEDDWQLGNEGLAFDGDALTEVGKNGEGVFGPPTEKYAWVEERMRYARMRRSEGWSFDFWWKERLMKTRDEKPKESFYDVRADRKADIERRLKEDTTRDWGDEDFKSVEWQTHKKVTEIKRMTDAIWKNVEPILVQFLEGQRAARREKEIREAPIKKRVKIDQVLYPRFINLVPGSKPTKMEEDTEDENEDEDEKPKFRFAWGDWFFPEHHRHDFSSFQIPLGAFLALESVKPLWNDIDTPLVASTLRKLDAETISSIQSDVDEFKTSLSRPFFDTLLASQREASKKYPDLDITPINVNDPSNPTPEEINSVLCSFPPAFTCPGAKSDNKRDCGSKDTSFNFPSYIIHFAECGERSGVLKELDYTPDDLMEMAAGDPAFIKVETWAILEALERAGPAPPAIQKKLDKEKEEKEKAKAKKPPPKTKANARVFLGKKEEEDPNDLPRFFCHAPHQRHRMWGEDSKTPLTLKSAVQHAFQTHHFGPDSSPSDLHFELYPLMET